MRSIADRRWNFDSCRDYGSTFTYGSTVADRSTLAY
jgi:hypothetical protein